MKMMHDFGEWITEIGGDWVVGVRISNRSSCELFSGSLWVFGNQTTI